MRKKFNVVSTAVAAAVAGSMAFGGVVLAQSNDTTKVKPKAPTAANASADARNPDAANTQIDKLNYSSGIKRDSRMSLDSPSRGQVTPGDAATAATTPAPVDTTSTSSTYSTTPSTTDTAVAPVATTSTPAPTTSTTTSSYDNTAPTLAPRRDRN